MHEGLARCYSESSVFFKTRAVRANLDVAASYTAEKRQYLAVTPLRRASGCWDDVDTGSEASHPSDPSGIHTLELNNNNSGWVQGAIRIGVKFGSLPRPITLHCYHTGMLLVHWGQVYFYQYSTGGAMHPIIKDPVNHQWTLLDMETNEPLGPIPAAMCSVIQNYFNLTALQHYADGTLFSIARRFYFYKAPQHTWYSIAYDRDCQWVLMELYTKTPLTWAPKTMCAVIERFLAEGIVHEDAEAIHSIHSGVFERDPLDVPSWGRELRVAAEHAKFKSKKLSDEDEYGEVMPVTENDMQRDILEWGPA